MKKAIRITLIVVLVIVVIVVAGGYLFYYNLSRSPLPTHDGELIVDGLKEKVEIFRDEWGIPHIYASNMYDLFFAQGYTQAQDRWWQMEFFRHVGTGTIEEITGKNTELLATDIMVRTMGWKQVAEQELEILDEDTLAHLQAFSDGVNAYIMNRKAGDLALEYGILKLTGINIEIEPWTITDSLVFGKIIAWQMGPQGSIEEIRPRLYDSLGEEMTEQWLTPLWPYDEVPTIIKIEDLNTEQLTSTNQNPDINQDIISNSPIPESILPHTILNYGNNQGIGSNNWVVSGELTETGMPLLANDPHLGIQMPSIWYEIGLHCHPRDSESSFDVVGFAFPISPCIIIGHNNSITWGITNVNPDVYDYYNIEVNPENHFEYKWNGELRDMKVRSETINFGDNKEPLTIKVRETHLGPIINDNQLDEETGELLGLNNEDPLVIHWTALEPSTTTRAIVGLNEAQNWQEFCDALMYFDVPSQNVVYADIEGNIGYQTAGKIPIRSANHSGVAPVPGWTDEYEWQGYIPYDNLPRLLNPDRDYIVTANQPVAPMEYFEMLAQELGEERNYIFSREWTDVYRAERIEEILLENIPHSIDTFKQMQRDNKQLSAEDLIPYLVDLHFNDVSISETRDWLLEWDYHCGMDSPHAFLYAQFWKQLVKNVFVNKVDEDILVIGFDREMTALTILMENPFNSWWDDVNTNDIVETRDDILVRSFIDACTAATNTLGDNQDNWKWGDVHTATFVSNPLGLCGIGLIENIVNRGPFAVNGTTETINNSVWIIPQDDFMVMWLSSVRMIIDMSDLSRSITINTTGQSGHPASNHYDDMIESWCKVEYHDMLWTREQVENAAVNKLTLMPAR